MNHTPRGNRLHIAIFGRRNAGKSSLINALTNQDIALVSDVAGTTTDPVYKAMEILPIGPVLIIDTAGIDDVGDIGKLRVEKALGIINKTDVAILVTDDRIGIGIYEKELLQTMKERNIPVVVAINKIDIKESENVMEGNYEKMPFVRVSAVTKEGIEELKEKLIEVAPADAEKPLLHGLVKEGDMVLLVTPIDSSAPKGRMILPQVQVIRGILDSGGIMTICKENEIGKALKELVKPPDLVITDSQVFKEVSRRLPKEIPLTSFSIIFANHKGDLKKLVEGTKAINKLREGAKILIAEGCTHHRQGDDIGTVKIPRWLQEASGKKLEFNWVNGTELPQDLREYDLIVHCGSCMQSPREMMNRILMAEGAGVPIVNYGVLIAYINNILERTLTPFS